MTFKTLTLAAAATLALCAGAAQATTVNGFANGGFEDVGADTAAAAWLGAAAGYTLSSDARTGSFAAQLASPAFNAAIMLQNSIEQGGLAPLTAGDNPMLSFWAKGTPGATGSLNFAMRYLDGIGNILADSMNVNFGGQINTSTWTEITYDLGAVPVGAEAAFIEFSQGIGPIGVGPAGEDWFPGLVLIDDLYLGVSAPIPEPGTYALLLAGLGVVGGIARRRRVAAAAA